MKNVTRMILTINIFFLFIINNSHAQIKVGLLGGINYSNIVNFNPYQIIRTWPSPSQYSEEYEKTLRSGLIFGLILDYPINENISLYIQPVFVIKKISFNNKSSAINIVDTYYNINVPLLVKFTPMKILDLNPFLNVGVGIEYLIKATSKIGINQDNEETRLYNKNNFLLLIGLGTDYSISQSVITTINLYYSYGLTNYLSNSSTFGRTSDISIVTGLLYKL
ncbi:MAG: PorT family protein [Melioribacteraceae bacterium]|nr:PorT family protein [Melioribacteraceae bacterium]